jgi:hypothetical protein
MDVEHNALFAAQTGWGTAGTPAAPLTPRVAINAFAVPGGVGVTGDRTRVQEYEVDAYGFEFGYQMAPGLKLYADIGHYDFEAPIPELENSGIVTYGGIYVSF